MTAGKLLRHSRCIPPSHPPLQPPSPLLFQVLFACKLPARSQTARSSWGCCEISPSIQTQNLLSPPPRTDLREWGQQVPMGFCSQLASLDNPPPPPPNSRTQNLYGVWGELGVEQSSCTARPCPRSVLLQYTLTKIESHFISIQQQKQETPPPPKIKPSFLYC